MTNKQENYQNMTEAAMHEGGKTSAENCQMLCKEDNRRKSGK